MRRLPVLLVLLATMCGTWAKAGFARVAPPTSEHKPRVQKVIQFARHQLGVRYSWGGTSRRTGFDCSGLVYAAYRSIGMQIPRSTWGQLDVGRRVGFARLQPGSLCAAQAAPPAVRGRAASLEVTGSTPKPHWRVTQNRPAVP